MFPILSGCASEIRSDERIDSALIIDIETSKDFLQESITSNPEIQDNYYRLAEILIDENNWDESLKVLQKYRGEHSEKYLCLLIENLARAGEMAKATELSSSLDGSSPEVLYVKSLVNFKSQNNTASLDYVNRAIGLDGGNAKYFQLKANVLLSIEDTISAVENFRIATNKENIRPRGYYDFIHLLLHIQDDNEADSISSLGLKHYPGSDLIQLANAEVKISSEDYQKAKEILWSINGPELFIPAKQLLLPIYFNSRTYDSVLLVSDNILTIDNHNREARLYAARSKDRLRKFEEAEKEYMKLKEFDTTDAIVNAELVKLQRKMRYLRDLKRKERLYRDVSPLQPEISTTP